MSKLINALIGGSDDTTTQSLLSDFNNSNDHAGYNLFFCIKNNINLNWTLYSPVTLFHYLTMYACVSPVYKKLLHYCIDKNSISDLNSSVDANGKTVDQYILALGMQFPQYCNECIDIIDYLVSNGLSLSQDNNGVQVVNNMSGGHNFNENEFISKFNNIKGGSSSQVITGMRQMNIRDDNNDTNSELLGGGDDHEQTLKIIASKLGLEPTDLKVKAIKSLLYNKVKNDYPDLHGNKRTAKLEEYASSNIMDSFTESEIFARMELLTELNKTKLLNKPKSDKPKSEPKKEKTKETKKSSTPKESKPKKTSKKTSTKK